MPELIVVVRVRLGSPITGYDQESRNCAARQHIPNRVYTDEFGIEHFKVRVRLGSPINGYGQESRNCAARQRIPNRVYTDEFGIEHFEVNFYIRGPHGASKVLAEMFKDQEDKQWKFTYLIVEINSPLKAQLMLESYMPAAASAPT
ncbi:probable mitochondrial import inner membrane translocase subunit TIM21 isoform X2 [Mangifera indica]|uniref:probable mitochondrial import inner membrane translocase subunit TIM21 isoform X2 n=1 Tax=Mangifera indica TaxID=29780 RepID=UPI001CF95BB4|nr:probable mitochondrial import inner membrane translocase subunit TIM21 isoform X2 [Mangifera indica]XP_044501450.1 probable mitochondrial import inner membrane translocase subunit TIM21 isoform X2 [Mangifera indica]